MYPADDVKNNQTSVVHYFTKEWVNMGYNVIVIFNASVFPKLYYYLARPFKQLIISKLGYPIDDQQLSEIEYQKDGVNVYRIPLRKIKPHSRFSKKDIEKAVSKSITFCSNNAFTPDVIISHWVNPQIEIMRQLKEHYKVPSCLVFHDEGFDLETIYEKDRNILLTDIDVLGYRAPFIEKAIIKKFGVDKPSFLCYSGIPYQYNDNTIARDFTGTKKIIFVGALIKRKHPLEIAIAANNAFVDKDFTITYVGNGNESSSILTYSYQHGFADKINLVGFVPRSEIINILDTNDIFVMISDSETFGLVYLEAMSRGCITIASIGGGFDGIIRDGENGFLCEAGSYIQLAQIFSSINSMSPSQLIEISNRAKETAKEMTDVSVAKKYIEFIENCTIR